MNGWFPSSRLGTPLPAKLQLGDNFEGGMRSAFPPYDATTLWFPS
jgi:hypothetical protein